MSTRDFIEKDYYAALGVPKDAGKAEIKKAYRRLARRYHPDANKGDAGSEEKFKEISEAYDVLSDDQRRKEYDEARALFGAGGLRSGGMRSGGHPGAGGGFSFDLGDLFANRGGQPTGGPGGLGDVLGGLFGGGGGRRGAAHRGADVEADLTLSFHDAAEGVTTQLRVGVPGPCPTCHGSGAKPGTTPRVCPQCEGTGSVGRNAGRFAFAEPCRDCRGRGFVVDSPCPACQGGGVTTTERVLTARIPGGVLDGQRIRLKGKGQPGESGGPAGDLVVTVHVPPHPLFGRSGDNLTLSVPVSFPEAALGATITVPTLGGAPVSLRLPSGTPNGRTFRVRGKGVRRRDGTRGDLLVSVEIAVPASLTPQAREALETLAGEMGADPRADLFTRAGNV